MAKYKDPLLEALYEGRAFTWTLPLGGDFASMRKAFKYGQTVTMSPIKNLEDISVGDIVCVKWHGGHIVHLVSEIQGDQYLIVNSIGKVNGWVNGKDIIGRVSQIVEPEERPSLPLILQRLEETYQKLIDHFQPNEEDKRRLLSIVEDLRWYADRIKPENWDKLPRSNRWSFQQNAWYLTQQAKEVLIDRLTDPTEYIIDQGKRCVGETAEICLLFEYDGTGIEIYH